LQTPGITVIWAVIYPHETSDLT